MRDMLRTLEGKLRTGDKVFSTSVTAYLAESTVAHGLGQLQDEFPEVDIGSYPFHDEVGYGTRLVVRGTTARCWTSLLRASGNWYEAQADRSAKRRGEACLARIRRRPASPTIPRPCLAPNECGFLAIKAPR